MQPDPYQFKNVLAQWSTGVVVATTVGSGGEWHGITATSFASVSLEPPLVLVCVSRSLVFRALVEQSGVFAINILSRGQVRLGRLFAGLLPEATDRFAGLDCTTGPGGSPLLPGAMGWLDCRVWQAYDGGDHLIFVGEVLAGGHTVGRPPLLYHDRHWGGFERGPALLDPTG